MKQTKEQKLNRKAHNIAWKIVANGDISTELSGNDVMCLESRRELFEEAAEDYKAFWYELPRRTDISDDDRWDLESLEDVIARYANVYEVLVKELT